MIAAALQLINSARSLSAKSWLVAIALVAIVAAAARLVTYHPRASRNHRDRRCSCQSA